MLKQILICLKRKKYAQHMLDLLLSKSAHKGRYFFLAGVAGFEPADVGVRIQCLTAWRHPKINFQNKNGHNKDIS